MADPYPHRQLGAIVSDGCTRFRIWAPACSTLTLELLTAQASFAADVPPATEQRLAMQPSGDGFFEYTLPQELAGARYYYVLPNGSRRPDPASRFQPTGVHGPSQVVDPRRYHWHDANWSGVAKQDLVIYELHLGAFTPEGNYVQAAERLPELKDLGVTAIELMPVAESAGRWNWGYDGVLFFAPRHTYGTPDELRQFVDAAHDLGLAVILDVVFNHFGPEGNYFRDFGPYISDKHSTAWGDAPNFDSSDSHAAQGVRDYFAANVSYWIDEFHFDGLRLDAIHCMSDESHPHIVSELSATLDRLRGLSKRHLHLIAESNVYDAQMLQHRDGGGYGYDAQWCDDLLHSVYSVLRPGEQMSQRVYSGDDLRATLSRGYVYAGSLHVPRRKVPLVDDAARVDLSSLIYSIQNHDFIGNHPLGQRLHQLTSEEAYRAAASLLMLVPSIPMLFMGEEFASPHPFYFFVDYSDAHLREAVERGRRAEYPQHDWTHGASPLSPAAFTASKIGPMQAGSVDTWQWVQTLIALRKQWQQLGLLSAATLQVNWNADQQTAVLQYQSADQSRFAVIRLSNAFMQHQPLILDIAGRIELSQNCLAQPDGARATLSATGVAIGMGTVHCHTTCITS